MYSAELPKSELAISTVMKKEERPVSDGREENTTSHVGGDDNKDAQTIVETADSYVPSVAAHPLCCAREPCSNSMNSIGRIDLCFKYLTMWPLRLGIGE